MNWVLMAQIFAIVMVVFLSMNAAMAFVGTTICINALNQDLKKGGIPQDIKNLFRGKLDDLKATAIFKGRPGINFALAIVATCFGFSGALAIVLVVVEVATMAVLYHEARRLGNFLEQVTK